MEINFSVELQDYLEEEMTRADPADLSFCSFGASKGLNKLHPLKLKLYLQRSINKGPQSLATLNFI